LGATIKTFPPRSISFFAILLAITLFPEPVGASIRTEPLTFFTLSIINF